MSIFSSTHQLDIHPEEILKILALSNDPPTAGKRVAIIPPDDALPSHP